MKDDHRLEFTADKDETTKYWTPERRKAAKPITPPDVRGLPEVPGLPEQEPPSKFPESHGEGQSGALRGYGARLGADPIPHPTEFPWRTVCKIFLQMGGQDLVASGFVVQERYVITAGHAIVHNGQQATRILAVPAFTNGAEPFGGYVAEQGWVPEHWHQSADWAFDVGVLQMAPNTSGQHIGAVVGFVGTAFDQAVQGARWIGVAYPGNYQSGNAMMGELGDFTRIYQTAHGNAVGKAGTFGGGASGGPWLLSGYQEYANGNQSFIDSRYPNEVFSPYWGTAIRQFFEQHIQAIELV